MHIPPVWFPLGPAKGKPPFPGIPPEETRGATNKQPTLETQGGDFGWAHAMVARPRLGNGRERACDRPVCRPIRTGWMEPKWPRITPPVALLSDGYPTPGPRRHSVLGAPAQLSDGYPTAIRRPSDGYPTAIRRPSDGYPTDIRRPSDGYPTDIRW